MLFSLEGVFEVVPLAVCGYIYIHLYCHIGGSLEMCPGFSLLPQHIVEEIN